MVPLPLVFKTSVLKTVYSFLFRSRLEHECSVDLQSELGIGMEKKSESELAYAHETEHGSEFRF